MLVFLVMFGPKKGSVVAYRSGWFAHMTTQAYSLINYTKLNREFSQLFKASTYRFTFTTVTSRTTSYFLFSFWCFFFFFGESLLLVTFNFTTPVDTITSSSFFTIKQHTIFYINTTSSTLLYHINVYIYLLTSSAILYLVNLNYSYNYYYFNQLYLNAVLSFSFVILSLAL